MATLFVSDLHLPAQPSPLREAFLRFLRGPAREAEALYILGDLFEHWIGDDIGLQDYAPEVAELAALAAGGVPVFFQHGNRDFLVDGDFAALTGATLLADPHVITLHGVPTLISHGDLFCTDDLAYQRWRRISRLPFLQLAFRLAPRWYRRRLAARAHRRSAEHKQRQRHEIMDVNDAAVRAGFAARDVSRIIHGHTHRPAEHVHEVGGRRCERIVLADWRGQRGEYLRVDAAGIARVPVA